jgi:hypothetical protein
MSSAEAKKAAASKQNTKSSGMGKAKPAGNGKDAVDAATAQKNAFLGSTCLPFIIAMINAFSQGILLPKQKTAKPDNLYKPRKPRAASEEAENGFDDVPVADTASAPEVSYAFGWRFLSDVPRHVCRAVGSAR